MREAMAKETKPLQVDESPKHGGEARNRFSWAEPAVWTDRMLAALEQGVKGNKWYSLIDKVYRRSNLEASFKKVKRNRGAAGVDHVTVEQFEERLAENLNRLEEGLRRDTYQPQQIRRKEIRKPGSKEGRTLMISTIRDRVVQGALKNVLEPIFEKQFSKCSYGFRPGRGCKHALGRVDSLLKAGYTWVVDADIKRCFDMIPHDRLMECLREEIADGKVLALIESFLKQGILSRLDNWGPERGTPQGAVISPLLANLYLNPLDHYMAGVGFKMTRYADDFVIQCRSEDEARHALTLVEKWLKDAGLVLNPEKTRIIDASQSGGFDFLGYHFERGYRWPSEKSLKKYRDSIRSKTRRCNGYSIRKIIKSTNQTSKGWFEYFKHSHYTAFLQIDSWVRMRLRSILRKRDHGRGRGRGVDNRKWPNVYFRELGLFSMVAAHASACQSSRR